MDQGYKDIPFYENNYSAVPQLEDLPYDYFFSTDYNYLTIPEVQLLFILSDSQISYTFSGLRKTSSLHQHQLAKALKRLQDRDLLSKNENGTYELTDLGSKRTRDLLQELINKRALNIEDNQFISNWKKLRLVPPGDKETIASYLEKRWFGNFRYLYRRDTEHYIELCWEDNNKDQVQLYARKTGNIEVEYRTKQPKFSEMQIIIDWVRNEIINQSEIQLEIKEESIEKMNEISYN
jgi:DNA-binding MarR family transcriptional regulator